MRFREWWASLTQKEQLSAKESIPLSDVSVSRLKAEKNIPGHDTVVHIWIASAGKVEPNDFYRLDMYEKEAEARDKKSG